MRLRLISSFVLVVAVAILSVAYLARQGAAGELRTYMMRGGMSGTGSLVASLEAYYSENGGWQGAEVQIQSFIQSRSQHGQGYGMGAGMLNQRLRLADATGQVLIDTSSTTASELLSLAERLSQTERETAIPLEVDNRTVGYLLAEGSSGLNRQDETLLVNRITRAALIGALIAGGVSLLLALYLAYRLLQPVSALTVAAHRMSGGDLSQRVQVHGTDELAVLGKTFNSMAESLQRSEESRKAMTADIAHELRNPLAVQRANLEAMIDGVYPLTPDNLAPVIEQNHMLTRLVEDLRTLALADAGQLNLEIMPGNLLELVERIAGRYRPQAAAQEIVLEVQLKQEDTSLLQFVPLDAMRIEQILGNLISNALRYTPQGGQIVVQAQVQDGQAMVRVQDSGPGIPEPALPYVFDRFYRADKARSRQEGGSGLGLAIARQLAQAHGGNLAAANHLAGGAIFTLTLPLA